MLLGIQCEHALYSWKLNFGLYQRLYELVLCACSAREEERWKAELFQCSSLSAVRPSSSKSDWLAPEIAPLYGPQRTVSRGRTLARTSTADCRNYSCHVILQNTHSVQDGLESPTNPIASLNRSRSLPLRSNVPILAPERANRVRLENLLECVWTKDLLPFPGMLTQTRGNFIRASKSSVLRKLSSKASTRTQSSAKTSLSQASLDDPFVEQGSKTPTHPSVTPPAKARSTYERYSTPEAFAEDLGKVNMLRKISFKNTPIRGKSDLSLSTSTVEDTKDWRDANKPGKAKTILKKFSSEGIRTWFD